MDDIYLLKFGGNAIKGKDDLDRLSSEVAGLIKDGAKIIMVHGGGPEINAEMERIGLVPKKVAGVRVTDDATLEVAERVLKDINDQVVEAMTQANVRAQGLPGHEVAFFERKKPYVVKDNGVDVMVDLINVGEVTDVDLDALERMLENGVTPIIYPIGKDDLGHLNVNADAMASGIAACIKCKEMIQITDVPGILLDIDDPSSLQTLLSLAQVDELIADGTISGGMVPKVEACRRALLAGVSKVRMVNGKDKKSIVSDVMQEGVEHGTVITK